MLVGERVEKVVLPDRKELPTARDQEQDLGVLSPLPHDSCCERPWITLGTLSTLKLSSLAWANWIHLSFIACWGE